MKCLIFSDSHGNTRNMKEAIARNSDAEVVFFLGDGLNDADTLEANDATRAWLAVAGNCDYMPLFKDGFVKKTDSITLMGKKIVFTHGDLYGVKYGMGGLLSLAGERGADIVLFGHTHEALEKYYNLENGGAYFFNPGSIGDGSYGLLLLTDKGILLSHGRI